MGSLVQFECWFYFCAFSNKTLHWEKKNKSWFHLLYEDNFMVHVVSFSTVSLLLKRFVMRVMWLKKQFSQNTPYSEMSLFLLNLTSTLEGVPVLHDLLICHFGSYCFYVLVTIFWLSQVFISMSSAWLLILLLNSIFAKLARSRVTSFTLNWKRVDVVSLLEFPDMLYIFGISAFYFRFTYTPFSLKWPIIYTGLPF